MLKLDLVLIDLGIGDTEEEFKEVLKCWGMVLGINLIVGADLVDEIAIHHMEVISSVEDTAVLKVWLELILTAVLVLYKLAMAVGYLAPAFLELCSKTYPETFCMVI